MFLKVIEWLDKDRNTIVHKVDFRGNTINKGSMLTVRDGQVAIFADKGKMADVFLPGSYKLDTSSIPVLTRLLSWKYAFEKPFKSDVYFVRTTQFVDLKWGTPNPIIIKDKDYGPIRVRGFGAFSFRVDDAYVFMQELSGAGSTYKTDDILSYLRSLIATDITKALGKSNIPILDMASNIVEIGNIVVKGLQPDFKAMGLQLVKFNVENFSLPAELEKMLDRNASMNMIRGNVDVVQQMATADALKDAAKNPGIGGAGIGAGMGVGMGVGMGQLFANNFGQASKPNQSQPSHASTMSCAKCKAAIHIDAKFCHVCGNPNAIVCSRCNASLPSNARFCPECGASTQSKCKSCQAELANNAKFCPECGAQQ
ncbi:MAG: SPFH domain-containing protein [Clostridiales bacterium]|jgi:membrane protease subunit (stomatin/prohibitin family)|nr:SPFH domain-containing protein [Clostridiales bacterium]